MGVKTGKRSAGKVVTAITFVAVLGAGWALYASGWALDVGLLTNGGKSVPRHENPLPKPIPPGVVSALGRLEPKDGVRRIAGPSPGGAVIGNLLVDEGDAVLPGEVIAVLDDYAILEGQVERLRARLDNAERELKRHEELYRDRSISASQRDSSRTQVDVIRAELRSADATLERAMVRTPVGGRVLKVHARTGELVGPEGIAEVGQTDDMYAVAEVYETDITRVAVGQRATVSSPALAAPLQGTVEQVGLKVTRQATLDTDPAVQTDARVIEVKIRLDDSERAAGLTDLRTEVLIEP